MSVMMCSRRTISDGEVVTFATDFRKNEGIFGGFDCYGPFEVSASTNAVIVHHASWRDAEGLEVLIRALRLADAVRQKLEPTRRRGAASMFPAEPTECDVEVAIP